MYLVFGFVIGVGGLAVILWLAFRTKNPACTCLPPGEPDDRLGRIGETEEDEANRAQLNMLAREVRQRHIDLDPVTGVVTMIDEDYRDH